MNQLITQANLAHPDDFYSQLLAAHSDRDPATSAAINTRLILLLANHIGDQQILTQALAAATTSIDDGHTDNHG